MAKGWMKTKRGKKLWMFRNDVGKQHSRTLGPASLTDAEAWQMVGELKLSKLVGKPDTSAPPAPITLGNLVKEYLTRKSFSKPSTQKLHGQILTLFLPDWGKLPATAIDHLQLKKWLLAKKVGCSTRGKYKSVLSGVYIWAQCEGLIPTEANNPCKFIRGAEFSLSTPYEALALEINDVFRVLANLKQPEYEISLLVVTCQLRISETLGLRWRDILWSKGQIAIRQTFVHGQIQAGAKTKLSRSRVEAPKLLLNVLQAWRNESPYAGDEDFVFPSMKMGGKQPRSGSMLVEDYIKPAALRAGVLTTRDGITYDQEGEIVKRFGFHVLGRHSIATFLMENETDPSTVQAVMRHARMDMTLHYSHAHRGSKQAAQEKVLQHLPQRSAGTSAGTGLMQ